MVGNAVASTKGAQFTDDRLPQIALRSLRGIPPFVVPCPRRGGDCRQAVTSRHRGIVSSVSNSGGSRLRGFTWFTRVPRSVWSARSSWSTGTTRAVKASWWHRRTMTVRFHSATLCHFFGFAFLIQIAGRWRHTHLVVAGTILQLAVDVIVGFRETDLLYEGGLLLKEAQFHAEHLVVLLHDITARLQLAYRLRALHLDLVESR